MIIDVSKLDTFKVVNLDHGGFELISEGYVISGGKHGPDMYGEWIFLIWLHQKGKGSIRINNVDEVREYVSSKLKLENSNFKKVKHPLEGERQ